MKNTPNNPKIGNGLVQLIRIGKYIRHTCVKGPVLGLRVHKSANSDWIFFLLLIKTKHIGIVARNPVFVVSGQVRPKPACSGTENS